MQARVSWLGIVVGAVCAGPASAQAPVASFAELSRALEKGTIVFVQDEAGQRTKGKVTDLSATTLQIMTGVSGRTVTFSADRVTRVSKVDSRLNGFLIGAIAGAVPGFLAGHWWNTYSTNEGGGSTPLAYVFFGVPLALAGGGIGFAIDGAIDGQTLVFARRTLAVSLKF